MEFVHPDDRGATATEAEKIHGGERTIAFENRYRCKDGSYRWLSWVAVPLPERGLIYAAARDITERKQAEAHTLALNQRLETSNKELEAFSYSVSHDLRAPLRGIDGFSQALLEDYGGKLDEQGRSYLTRVRAASQRMAQLIDDLLNLSRVGRAELRMEMVDLSSLAQALTAELQAQQPQRQAIWSIQQNVTAQGDVRFLRVVLDNLLNNAWKFTSKQSKATIEFGVTSNNGKPSYFVRDNGVGFDMTYANKLFGAFQRLHHQNEFPGTGIGLATVQRIIHRHSGRVWAEGVVEKGATFYFTLNSMEGTPHG
jgi:light-regulated signal transduction histidine kinase (bacteriophytochrome)